jgi:lipoic acid synthetase
MANQIGVALVVHTQLGDGSSPSRCVYEMSRGSFAINTFRRSSRLCRSLSNIRCLATPSSKADFSQTLEGGPSLDDFISGDVSERIVLGNTKA